MTPQEIALEIVKAWLAQRGSLAAQYATKEIREVFLEAVKTVEESYSKE